MAVVARSPDRGSKSLLICPDRAKAEELVRALGPSTPLPLCHHAYPSGAVLIGLLSRPEVELCFVDAETDRETALRLIAEIAARAPELPIVALLGVNDPDLILRCLRAGAREFLLRPFTQDQWETVRERVSPGSARSQPGSHKFGRLILIAPGKGSSGATSIACNLAFQLKRQGFEKVLLADLDPLTGTIGFLLKLKSSYSFFDALTHADRLDADVWKALISPCRNVDVLLSPEDPLAADEDRDPTALMEFCRRSYDICVLDTSGAFGEWNLALARCADELLVVTTADLPALHATQRLMCYFEDNGIERSRFRLVLNRYPRPGALTADHVQAALACEVYHTVPEDAESLQRALMEGKPAPPASRFARSLAVLARKLAGQGDTTGTPSLLSMLLGKR